MPALGAKTPLVLLEWDNGGRKTVQEFLDTYIVQGKFDSERKLGEFDAKSSIIEWAISEELE